MVDALGNLVNFVLLPGQRQGVSPKLSDSEGVWYGLGT